MHSWVGPAWSLKNEEFQIGLVDCPCMEPENWEGISNRTQIFVQFFDTMLLSGQIDRESVSPEGEFFFYRGLT